MRCSERKNVNLPGVVVDLPTLTEKDIDDLTNWALPNEADLIAASFVRKGSDLDYIRKVCFVRACVWGDTRNLVHAEVLRLHLRQVWSACGLFAVWAGGAVRCWE